jgi:hypothetical protein
MASFGILAAKSRQRAPAGSAFWASGALSSLGALDDLNSFLNYRTDEHKCGLHMADEHI